MAKMNTCGTCKHKGEAVRNGRGEPTTFFLCALIKHCPGHIAEKKGECAMVIDGSDYYAALCVEDEFGCNKWEAKP